MVTEATEKPLADTQTQEATSTSLKPESNRGWFTGADDPRRNVGRPRRGKTYAELARNRPDKAKEAVILAMEEQALSGRVNAAEFLRDTAEGRPRQTIAHEDDGPGVELRNRLLGMLAAHQGITIEGDYTELTETPEA